MKFPKKFKIFFLNTKSILTELIKLIKVLKYFIWVPYIVKYLCEFISAFFCFQGPKPFLDFFFLLPATRKLSGLQYGKLFGIIWEKSRFGFNYMVPDLADQIWLRIKWELSTRISPLLASALGLVRRGMILTRWVQWITLIFSNSMKFVGFFHDFGVGNGDLFLYI